MNRDGKDKPVRQRVYGEAYDDFKEESDSLLLPGPLLPETYAGMWKRLLGIKGTETPEDELFDVYQTIFCDSEIWQIFMFMARTTGIDAKRIVEFEHQIKRAAKLATDPGGDPAFDDNIWNDFIFQIRSWTVEDAVHPQTGEEIHLLSGWDKKGERKIPRFSPILTIDQFRCLNWYLFQVCKGVAQKLKNQSPASYKVIENIFRRMKKRLTEGVGRKFKCGLFADCFESLLPSASPFRKVIQNEIFSSVDVTSYYLKLFQENIKKERNRKPKQKIK